MDFRQSVGFYVKTKIKLHDKRSVPNEWWTQKKKHKYRLWFASLALWPWNILKNINYAWQREKNPHEMHFFSFVMPWRYNANVSHPHTIFEFRIKTIRYSWEVKKKWSVFNTKYILGFSFLPQEKNVIIILLTKIPNPYI